MIIGRINGDEKRVKFNVDIKCSNCKAQVPGGIQASEKYYGTDAFYEEMEVFKKKYLCGRCRDKNRIKIKKNTSDSILSNQFESR